METLKETKISSFLTFKIENEKFAVHVSKVTNILEKTKITPVPNTPAHMKGIINLRGNVLPVIDTRIKLGLSSTEMTENTCIIVLDFYWKDKIVYIGALVDAVSAVIEIEDRQIEAISESGNLIDHNLFKGIANINEEFIQVLNPDYLFREEIKDKSYQ